MVPMSEYQQRRQQVMTQMGPNSVAFLPAAPELIRNGDGHHLYRQNSNFVYLSGFEEPEAVVCLIPGRPEGEFILFCRPRNPDSEAWDGPRAGLEGACQTYGADEAFASEDFVDVLPQLLQGRDKVYYPVGQDSFFDDLLMDGINELRAKVRAGVAAPEEFANIEPLIHELRLFKSDNEIRVLSTAAEISVEAHLAAIKACKPGMNEYELEAELMREFYRHGSRSPAYTSIVGSGNNACVLHYIANNRQMQDGDLVLIDAGAEFHNYASDITRTFPVNGKFSDAQRAIYQIVLDAQMAAVESVKPGVSWHAIQEVILQVMVKGMVDIGLLAGEVDSLIAEQAYMPFYWHRSGHWLGLDTHDVGNYKVDGEWRTLEPGMVFTIEPGIYIAEDNQAADGKWRGIGVRIEDDILVTDKGHEVLTVGLPKRIDDIEALMASL
ncbi:MAG: Xaa-Pro aminopeptidase [Legionellales bacterium]|nr:Xaa-Pro aminopeptidase [Legionellales bacterium]